VFGDEVKHGLSCLIYYAKPSKKIQKDTAGTTKGLHINSMPNYTNDFLASRDHNLESSVKTMELVVLILYLSTPKG